MAELEERQMGEELLKVWRELVPGSERGRVLGLRSATTE
jgi:hypothetical protein